MHGHNYRCQVVVEGAELDHIGLLVDFVELKRVVHSVLDRLDHQWLNEFPPFDVLNPSAENIARYIYEQVLEGLKVREGVRSGLVRLWETDTGLRYPLPAITAQAAPAVTACLKHTYCLALTVWVTTVRSTGSS